MNVQTIRGQWGSRVCCEGDFDSDTDIDLAVANRGANDVWILLGKGDGTFAAALRCG
jgi:hypothetical protein